MTQNSGRGGSSQLSDIERASKSTPNFNLSSYELSVFVGGRYPRFGGLLRSLQGMEAEMEVSGCSVLELEENKREPEPELELEPGTGNDADIGDAAEKGGPSEANGDGGADGSESRDTQQNLNLSSGPSGSGSEPKRTRLKLFNKVMEKSLQRLITDAR